MFVIQILFLFSVGDRVHLETIVSLSKEKTPQPKRSQHKKLGTLWFLDAMNRRWSSIHGTD